MKSAQKYEAGILITILTLSALGAGPLLISSPSWAQNVANNTSSDQSLEEAKLSYLSVWNNTEFNATFNTFIEENSALGYRVYEEHATNNLFRPGETMVLYVEPVGFGHMPLIDEQGNTLYLMNMTADYVISDGQGNELDTIPNIPVGSIISHRQNTELFLESFPVAATRRPR